MAAPQQNSPKFDGGGSVFGRIAAQWNQFFAAKVDAEGGTADNLTLTGTIVATLATITGWANALFQNVTVNSNATLPPTKLTGTLVQVLNADGQITRVELASFGQPSFVTARSAGGTNAAPLPLGSGVEIRSDNVWGYDNTVAPGTATHMGESSFTNWAATSAAYTFAVPFKTVKHADPAIITIYNPASGTSGQIFDSSAGTEAASVSLAGQSGFRVTANSAYTAGGAGTYTAFQWLADASIIGG
jgi:hypothetical protein